MIQSLGFIGFGSLAKTLCDGFKDIIKSNHLSILINSRNTANSKDINYLSKESVLNDSDIIFIAVKPQQLVDIMPDLTRINWNHKCLVSLLAGVPLSVYAEALPQLTHAFRVMPNTAAKFQESMSTYTALSTTNDVYKSFIISLFSSIGSIIQVAESQFDYCTALCGSGPAFLYHLFESMIELSQAEGFTLEQSRSMVNQLAQGIASSLNNRPDSLDRLISEICSPKGTTEAGMMSLYNQQISEKWKTVFCEAKNRSIELSKAFKSV